jgi:hypothetical protein
VHSVIQDTGPHEESKGCSARRSKIKRYCMQK